MVRLTQSQIDSKIKFIDNYIHSANAADGSKLDANANVSSKNIATLAAEINKDVNIQVNRELIVRRIEKRFGNDLAIEYKRQLEAHEIYCHDETSLSPYCTSITLFPFLLEGLKSFGGETKPPKHLSSFNGGFINLVFAVASQFAGAVATVEWLMYFDYFARKEYGNDYLLTHPKEITQQIQSVVYALNQPAAARGFQSVFWNISIYDKPYFDAMFSNFRFPDNKRKVKVQNWESKLHNYYQSIIEKLKSENNAENAKLLDNFEHNIREELYEWIEDEEVVQPNYESLSKLQVFFMEWFNKERTKAVLTFPVVTAACLNDGNTMVDKEFESFISKEYAEGNSFFTFTSGSAHALSSCCRLKNDISDQINDFSYSLGAGGVSTGSLNVITLNINRLIQDGRNIVEEVEKIHKYQMAFRELYEEYIQCGMMPTYDAGYITIDKQYLTVGINGVVEAAEYLGYKIDNNEEYKNWVSKLLKEISDLNKVNAAKYKVKFNTEFVPGESLGVKFAKWDKADGYFVPRDCYNSYLYKVEDNEISVLDKFSLHGKDTSQFLDGGSAYHCNLESYPTAEGFKKLLNVSVKEGCDYFCFNIKVTGCSDCGTIDKRTLTQCAKCSSKNVWWATRVIGYLKKIKDFSSERQNEANMRFYAKS